MKIKTKAKNFVSILSLGLLAILLALTFSPYTSQTAYGATEITITTKYIEDDTVNLFHLPERFDVKAELSGYDDFSGTDIEWLLNGESVEQNLAKDDFYIQKQANPISSTLLVYKNQFKNVEGDTVWTFTARISSSPSIVATKKIYFSAGRTTPLKIELKDGQSNIQQLSENLEPFVFVVSGLEDISNVEWFEKTSGNKFIKIPDENSSTYSYTPTGPGSKTIVAKVGEYYSLPKTVYVTYVPFYTISFKVSQLTNAKNGLNKYRFVIEGLSSTEHDIDNINWYIQGYNNPVQYGGLVYDFQPTSYAYYRIVAKYEGEYGVAQSDPYLIEIKIDRTREILFGFLILVGVMGIFTTIGIVRRIKKEKIW